VSLLGTFPLTKASDRLRLVSGSLKDASAAILKMAAGDTAEKVRPIFFTLEKKEISDPTEDHNKRTEELN
jgi:hypothetical protein